MKKTPPLTWFERRSVMLFASLSLAAAGQTFAPSHAPKPDRASRSEAAAVVKQADRSGPHPARGLPAG